MDKPIYRAGIIGLGFIGGDDPGFREFDAYHVASAESGGCDRLITCDDRFLNAARRNAAKISVRVTDPISLVSEANF